MSNLMLGWQASAFPATLANDYETPPFPIRTPLGGGLADEFPSAAPLVIYRVLRDDTLDSSTVLRALKSATTPGTIELIF